MKSLVAQAMEDGAFGMSTGLDKGLVPGCFATTEELIEVAKVVSKYGGFYASHVEHGRRTEAIITLERHVRGRFTIRQSRRYGLEKIPTKKGGYGLVQT